MKILTYQIEARYNATEKVSLTFEHEDLAEWPESYADAIDYCTKILFDNGINPFRYFRVPVLREATIFEKAIFYYNKLKQRSCKNGKDKATDRPKVQS